MVEWVEADGDDSDVGVFRDWGRSTAARAASPLGCLPRTKNTDTDSVRVPPDGHAEDLHGGRRLEGGAGRHVREWNHPPGTAALAQLFDELRVQQDAEFTMR